MGQPDARALARQLDHELEVVQARLDGLHTQATAINTIIHSLSLVLSELETRVTTMRTIISYRKEQT
jgi:hypothetical protein